MATPLETFHQLKQFLAFDDADAARLRTLGPLFEQAGPGITDRFYGDLGRFPETAALLEGQVERLKGTHGVWMMALFAGEYGEPWFERQLRIGQAHVRVGLSPHWVEAVMDVMRTEGTRAILAAFEDKETAAAHIASYTKILDLDLAIINLAYNEERLDRLTRLTGMRRALIEKMVMTAGKKK
ncbi:MAG: hypothetical protein H6739_20480 [Alphaproteobacteria bacterium]|nr:hypothetical protein [Alphaproteobacteria bacterium]